MIVDIDGLTVELVRKKVRRLRMSVHPPNGRVRISAPLSLKQEVIIDFVRQKRGWIETQQARIGVKQALTPSSWVSGESLSVFGNCYTLEIVGGAEKCKVELSDRTVLLYIDKSNNPELCQSLISKWYRGLLLTEIEHYLPIYEGLTGLKCSSWQIRDMSTRWGSCNTNTGKLWFSLNLAKYPVICLEYVILHELAHLRYPDHGADFKAFVGSIMPDWKDRRKLLHG